MEKLKQNPSQKNEHFEKRRVTAWSEILFELWKNLSKNLLALASESLGASKNCSFFKRRKKWYAFEMSEEEMQQWIKRLRAKPKVVNKPKVQTQKNRAPCQNFFKELVGSLSFDSK